VRKSIEISRKSSANHPSSAGKVQSSLSNAKLLPVSLSTNENDMTSMDWLKRNGVEAQKLDFMTILQEVAFRHCDGVVKLFHAPDSTTENYDNAPAVCIFDSVPSIIHQWYR
jgi:hypothetical protein